MIVEERSAIAADVRRMIRDIPDFPKPGIVFRDITPVLANAPLFSRAIRAMASPLEGKGISHVVSIESRGFILGAPMAMTLGAAFVPVRKPGKLPCAIIREDYMLEYGTDALEMHADALRGATGIVVVDDVLATGGTAAATCKLIERAGGTVASCAFLIEIAALGGRGTLRGVLLDALVTY